VCAGSLAFAEDLLRKVLVDHGRFDGQALGKVDRFRSLRREHGGRLVIKILITADQKKMVRCQGRWMLAVR
jgi:hypothetical protein